MFAQFKKDTCDFQYVEILTMFKDFKDWQHFKYVCVTSNNLKNIEF